MPLPIEIVCFNLIIHQCEALLSTHLFADATPGVVENGVLVARNRGVQLLQHYLHTAVAMDKPTDVVHHGGLTKNAGALV